MMVWFLFHPSKKYGPTQSVYLVISPGFDGVALKLPYLFAPLDNFLSVSFVKAISLMNCSGNGETREELATMASIQMIAASMSKIELRDLFAMNAMNSIINSHTNNNLADIINEFSFPRTIPQKEVFGHDVESEEKLTSREWIAKASYMMADAMIKARSQK